MKKKIESIQKKQINQPTNTHMRHTTYIYEVNDNINFNAHYTTTQHSICTFNNTQTHN